MFPMHGWLNILDFITFVYLSWSNDVECGFLWACIGDRIISIDLILYIQAALCMRFDCFLLYISGHADTQLMSSLKSFFLYFSKIRRTFCQIDSMLPCVWSVTHSAILSCATFWLQYWYQILMSSVDLILLNRCTTTWWNLFVKFTIDSRTHTTKKT